jgi:hypothetical protein
MGMIKVTAYQLRTGELQPLKTLYLTKEQITHIEEQPEHPGFCTVCFVNFELPFSFKLSEIVGE